MRESFASEVTLAAQDGKINNPTESQWEMIFSDHPATCVIAGAGSGKSSSLVLRIVFMVKYLKIPFYNITAFSFTKTSCKELRKSLTHTLNLFGISITEAESKPLVRTFHSALYQLAITAFPNAQFFQNIRPQSAGKQGPSSQFDEDDIENPFSSTKLNDDQIEHIKSAYLELFSTNNESGITFYQY